MDHPAHVRFESCAGKRPGGEDFRRASALRVSLVMGRHALDVFGQQITRRQAADVAKTKDANHPLALVDHWQPTNLQLFHVPHRLGEVIIIAAAMDAWSHHIACCRAVRIKAFLRQPLTYDIAVGDHPNQLIVLSNWNGAHIMVEQAP